MMQKLVTVDSLISTASRVAHGVHGRVAGQRLLILIYHRVHSQADAIFPHEMDIARFDQLMRFVARSFRVMTLGQAVARLARDELPPRALVVTFDDGYADNAELALPILQRHGLVATFFVSTGFLDGGLMWNDSVIETVRACRHTEMDLESFGLGHRSLRESADRRALIENLLPRIKYLSLIEREQAISRLRKLSGVANLPVDLMMSSEQVRQLNRAGMEIGAHTVNHPILMTLAPAEAEREIVGGRDRLQELINAPVQVFAYPNGRPGSDYDHSHVELLRRLGFSAAVSTVPGVAGAGTDLHQLPRYTPWGHSTAAWAMRLFMHLKNTRYDVARAPGC